MKKFYLALTIFFTVAVITMLLLNLLVPDVSFSENENRFLAQSPAFSWEKLFSGEYTKNFENYLTDQFPYRDFFVSTKAFSENALGKTENNGIILGKEQLFQKFDTIDYEQLNKNIHYVNSFAKKSTVPVYILLVPESFEILSHKLPDYSPNHSQREVLNYIYANLDERIVPVDVYNTLVKHKEDYIFYRTDHHWTTYGAYLCNNVLLEALNKPVNTEYSSTVVAQEFNGTLYSFSGVRWLTPDVVEQFTFEGMDEISVHIFDTDTEMKGMFDTSYLEKKDIYSYFLGGNRSLLRIDAKGLGNTLFIKDSFANCLMTIYAKNANTVHAADLRFYKGNLMSYCEQNEIDEIVLLYSVSDFINDQNFVMLSLS